VLEKYPEWFFEEIVFDSVKKQRPLEIFKSIIGSYLGTGLFI
jgi:hypothetical protein